MNVEFGYQLIDDFDRGIINFGTAYQSKTYQEADQFYTLSVS